MKVLAAALAVLLLVAICSLAEADPSVSSSAALSKRNEVKIPTACCFSYMSRPVPRRMISSAYMTSNLCTQPAVILVTTKGRKLCADPRARWVQEYLEHMELQEY
ncbi:C-C motif chemokine 5-like [Agelaius tricolor]|uniref:C-C motif chemokine 5-like n=1 Tax=Agelaius tricolor TaxID=9191 RepID=UPI0039F1F826